MPITAVLFDLDETLVMEQASNEAAFLATCELARRRHGVDPQALTQSVRQRARDLWRASPTIDYCLAIGISSWEGLWARFVGDDPGLEALREWAPAYRREVWSGALADHGVRDAALVEELAAAFREERSRRHVPFADAESTLEELRGGYRLALVTNGPPDIQREKLERSGLARHFETVVISGEIGVGKPDPRIFALALDRLATPAAEAAMVGDSLSRDIAGAQQAGVRAIWINRDGRDRGDPPSEHAPDVEISRLGELRDVLKGEGSH